MQSLRFCLGQSENTGSGMPAGILRRVASGGAYAGTARRFKRGKAENAKLRESGCGAKRVI